MVCLFVQPILLKNTKRYSFHKRCFISNSEIKFSSTSTKPLEYEYEYWPFEYEYEYEYWPSEYEYEYEY